MNNKIVVFLDLKKYLLYLKNKQFFEYNKNKVIRGGYLKKLTAQKMLKYIFFISLIVI